MDGFTVLLSRRYCMNSKPTKRIDIALNFKLANLFYCTKDHDFKSCS